MKPITSILDKLNSKRYFLNPSLTRPHLFFSDWIMVDSEWGRNLDLINDIRAHGILGGETIYEFHDGSNRVLAFWGKEDSSSEYEYLYMLYGSVCHKVSRWPHAAEAKKWESCMEDVELMKKHTKKMCEHIRECMGA